MYLALRGYLGVDGAAAEQAVRAQVVAELHWTFEDYDNARLVDLGDLMGYWAGKAKAEEMERGGS